MLLLSLIVNCVPRVGLFCIDDRVVVSGTTINKTYPVRSTWWHHICNLVVVQSNKFVVVVRTRTTTKNLFVTTRCSRRLCLVVYFIQCWIVLLLLLWYKQKQNNANSSLVRFPRFFSSSSCSLRSIIVGIRPLLFAIPWQISCNFATYCTGLTDDVD